jgi:hypothetical protein
MILYKRAARAVFVYGFAKNERANITQDELATLKELAAEILTYDDTTLARGPAGDQSQRGTGRSDFRRRYRGQRAIIEALGKLYGGGKLAGELKAKQARLLLGARPRFSIGRSFSRLILDEGGKRGNGF